MSDRPSLAIKRYPIELAQDADTVVRLDRTRLLLGFREPQARDALVPRLLDLDLDLEPSGAATDGGPQSELVNHTDRRFWVRTSLGSAIDGELHHRIGAAFDEQLEWIGPVYHDPHVPGRASLHCPLPNALIVKASIDLTSLREDTSKSRHLTGYRYYAIDEPRRYTAHEVRTGLLERESYGPDDILFENMPMLIPLSFEPADTFYPPGPQPGLPSYGGQWNLLKIRAFGPGRTAFDVVSTGANITIAVVDSGCDLTHPDLRLVAGAGGPNNDGANTSVTGFAAGHGTMCAGVAAGITHNLKGVASVAGYQARVMPLAFTSFTNFEALALVQFAVNNGARVISMSFNTTGWGSTVLTDQEFTRAYNNNVILCASSGNAGGAVTYPATHARVIACGATDRNDARAPFSNFGNPLSVVAPGVGVPTTTVQGTGDLSDLERRDWVSSFGGTSAAAPHVAGLAALLLCMDSTLTSDEVRNIIEGTADRVPPVPYNLNRPNGPWNNNLGHGRINALDALLATLPARQRR